MRFSVPFAELQRQLAEQFSVSLLHPVAPPSGSTNFVVLFDDYVARVHSPAQAYRTEAYVQVEVAVLDALEAAAFAGVPRVLATQGAGEKLFRWRYGEACGHGLLMTRLPGRSLPPCRVRALAVAAMLARLHQTLLGAHAPFRTPAAIDEALAARSQKECVREEDICAAARRVRDLLVDRHPFAHETNARIVAVFDILLLDAERALLADQASAAVRGIVHLDLNSSNWLWHENQEGVEIPGLVDFDFCAPGVLLLDISYCLVEWCIDWAKEPKDLQDFLDAYSSHRPMAPGERALLPHFFGVMWLKTLSWVFGQSHWSIKPLMEYGHVLLRRIDTTRNLLLRTINGDV